MSRDVAGLRANRHTNADFVTALQHGVVEHAIEADARQVGTRFGAICHDWYFYDRKNRGANQDKMSESYGQCEFNLGTAGNRFYNNLWQQAAAQGITAFVSAGDNGSAGCDFELAQGLLPPQPAQYGLQVHGLGSTPYNVSVGGTDFNDYFNLTTYWNPTSNSATLTSAKGYISETTWNDSCTNVLLGDPHFPLTTNQRFTAPSNDIHKLT